MKPLVLFLVVFFLAVSARSAPEDARVDELVLRAIDRKADLNQIGGKLEQLGEAATSRLAEHVRGKDRNMRLAALVCLQFCWSDQAKDAVIEIIPDTDKESRRLGFHLLSFRIPGKELAAMLSKLTNSENPEVVRNAIRLTLRSYRDKDLLKRTISQRESAEYLAEVITGYYGRDLSNATRRLLNIGTPEQRSKFIVALIHQQDTRRETRELIVRHLGHSSVMLRDRAAEFLRWHGTTGEVRALRAALKKERDPFAKASMQAAMEAMKLHYELFMETGENVQGEIPEEPTEAYRECYDLLKAAPTKINRAHAMAVLSGAEPFEPYYQHGLTKNTEATESRLTERLRLQVLTSGYPLSGISRIGQQPQSPGTVKRIPDDLIAETLMPPLREYYDEERKSFAIFIGKVGGPFDNLYHMGDDTAWNLEHETIVAIGDGLVRRVCVGQGAWGGLVIVEHKDAEGNAFCSLYSHLCPLVAVREGDVVAKGQKVGSLGRSYTREGGGFAAHIHFGIHAGPYDQSKQWITGYLTPNDFQSGHGWVEPQEFIRKRSGPK